MISDVVLIIMAAMLGFLHAILLIPDALISIGQFNLMLLPMIGWIFTPLRFFSFWIDMTTLGIVINYAFIITGIWFLMRIVLFAVGFIPGIGRANKTLNGS